MTRQRFDGGHVRKVLFAAARSEEPSPTARASWLVIAEASAEVADGAPAARWGWAAWKIVGLGVLAGLVVSSLRMDIFEASPYPSSPSPPNNVDAKPASSSSVVHAGTQLSVAASVSPATVACEPAAISVDALPVVSVATQSSAKLGARHPMPGGSAVAAEAVLVQAAPPPPIEIPPSVVAAPPSAVSTAELAEEMRRMEQARRELRSGNPSDALRALEEYQTAFPAGALADEALVLRMESLVALRRHEAGKPLALHFLAERPRSPYIARVRRLLSTIDERGSVDTQKIDDQGERFR